MIAISKKNDMKDEIVKVLKGHPEGLTTQNLSDMLKVSRNTVIRYASELKGEEAIYIRREGAVSLHYLKDLMKKFHRNFEKGFSGVPLLITFIIISILVPLTAYYGPSIVGMFVGPGIQKSEIYVDFIGLEVNESKEYNWTLNNTCSLENCRLGSIKVSGSIVANSSGNVSIFIENFGKRYLILNKSFQLNQTTNETNTTETNQINVNETSSILNETNQTSNVTQVNTEIFYFVDVCEETCNITDIFNQSHYNLIFDISSNVTVYLDSIRYVWEWFEAVEATTSTTSISTTIMIPTTTTTQPTTTTTTIPNVTTTTTITREKKVEVQYKTIEDDPTINSKITSHMLGNDLIIEYSSDSEPRIEGLSSERYRIDDEKIVVYNYNNGYFRLVFGKGSDVYEFGIVVINVQSHPMLYGNWTVEFTTIGTANLTIKAVDGTTWSDINEDNDLKFLEVACGNKTLDYKWINDSVFIADYSCDATGYEISKVLTSGKHTLEFRFGNDIKYAYNEVEAPTYSLNSTNNTLAGQPTLFSLNWTDNVGLSGYVFQFCNGIWNGTHCTGSASIGLENFTTYTEVDPNNHITLNSTHIDFDAYESEDAYVYKDMGVDHFGTVWEHKVDVKAISSDSYGQAHVWALANLVDDYKGIDTANDNELTVYFYRSTSTYSLYLAELYLGTIYSTYYAVTWGTPYYLTIKRDGSALTCKIYNDSARTNLLSTLSLTLHAGQPSHRYVYASQTYIAGIDYNLDCDVDNLDLQETWVNNTWQSFGASTWSNVTKVVNPKAGAKIAWCIYANDTSNNWNGTSCANPFSYVTTGLALDGSVHAVHSSGVITLALTTSIVNDVIIVGVMTSSSSSYRTVSSVTSNPVLTWSFRKRAQRSGNYLNTEEWYATWASSGLLTINVTLSGTPSNWGHGVAWGISGANTTTIFDPDASLPAGAGAGSLPISVSINTNNSNDFIFGICGLSYAIGPDIGAGYTTILTAVNYGTEYKIVTETQTGLAVNFIESGSNQWALIADAIVQAAVADTAAPTYSNIFSNVTNNTAVNTGTPINISAQWNDNVGLSMYVNSSKINDTGSWTNGTTWQTFTTGNWSNFTVIFPSQTGSNITVKIYANDTSNNQNVTGTWFWWNVTPDTTSPQYSNNQSQLVTTYTPTGYSNFSITWTDNSGSISGKYLENNFTGTLQNTSMSGTYPNYYYNSSSLAARTYQFRFVANDSSGNSNATGIQYFTINKAVLSGSVSITPSTTVTYPNQTTANYSETNTGDGDVIYKFYRDNVEKSSPETITLGVGGYTYKLNTTSATFQNYTANSSIATQTLTVNQNNTNPVDIYLINSTGTYKNQNITVTYGTQTTANATMVYSNSGTANLTEDGLSTTNPRTTTLSVGAHSYKGNITGNTNYTSNSTGATYYVIVVDTTPPTYSLNSTNSTSAGIPVEHRLKWTDDVGLSKFIFSFDNCTGTLVNDTTVYSFTANPNWSNITKIINSTVNCTIRWCVYANDTSNNWNGTSCVSPFSYLTTKETVAPLWRNQTTNDTDNMILQGEAINLTAQGKDETALDWAWLSTNETSVWQNKTGVYNSPMNMTKNSDWQWSNFTWSNSSVAQGTIVGWKIYYNDTSGNVNATDIATFTIGDTTPPKYGNITAIPASPAAYSPGATYTFNISWSDVSGISKVIFEWNGTTNYTNTANPAPNNYSYTLTDLASANYTYRWYANDTSDNWNDTIVTNTSTFSPPTKDSYVESMWNPNDNFGSETKLYITWDSTLLAKKRTFLEFDISSISSGSTIDDATIILYLENGEYGRTHYINRITESWTEDGITWNNQPAVTETNKVSCNSPDFTGWWDYVHVTALVQDALDVGTTAGLRIRETEVGSGYFITTYRSKEYGGYNPGLNITWTTGLQEYTINKAKPVLIMNNGTASVNTSGLVGYWRFEEGAGTTASDWSGNNNYGTINSANWVAGMYGNALNMSGSSSSNVTVTNSPSVNLTGNITISAWVKPEATNNRGIIEKVGNNGEVNQAYLLFIEDGSPHFKFRLYPGGQTVSSTTVVTANQWYYVTGVYNGTDVSIYVNGIYENAVARTGAIASTVGGLVIGTLGSNVYPFLGTIDEVQIFNRSLSADEIRELYESRVTYPTQTKFNCSANTNQVSPSLFWNTTNVTLTHNNTLVTLGAGYHYYLCNNTATQNYTQSAILLPLNITKAVLSGSLSTPTVTYPTSLTATASESNNGDSDVAYRIYCDEILVASATGSAPSGSYQFGAGNHNCKFNTTGGTFGNWTANSSIATSTGTVNQNNTNPVNLYLNGTLNSNRTYTYPEVINATGAAVYINSGTVNLYRDGVAKSNPETTTLGNGSYAYKVNITGNANYSSNATGVTFYALVNKASPTISISLTNNNTDYGLTDTAQCSITTGDSSATLTLYRNTSQVATGTTPIQESVVLPAGYWNYTCVYSQSQNYTSTSTTSWMLINKAKPVLIMNNATSTVNTSGLVGYWRFESINSTNGTADYSGYGNDGTAYNFNTNPASTVTGRFGNAVDFDGSNDYVKTPPGFSDLGTSNRPYSFAGWFKAASGETDGNIIHMSSLSGGTGWCLPPVALDGGKIRGYSWTGSGVSVHSTTTVVSGQWYHFVNTWDSTNGLRIYVNGVLENTTSMASYSASGTSNYLWLAFSPGGCSGDKGFFNGTIDEVQIFNRSLTADEIKELYESKVAYGTQTSFNVTESNSGDVNGSYLVRLNATKTLDDYVGYWALDDATGATAKDMSANGNTGTLTNMNTTGNATSGWNRTDCKYGSCLKFDGVNDYVDVANNDTLNFNLSFTVNLWIKSNSIISYGGIFSKTDGSSGYACYSDGTSNMLRCALGNGTLVGNTFNDITPFDGAWHFVSFIVNRSANKAYAYMDGVKSSTDWDISSIGNLSNSANFVIGKSQIGNYFNGTIDEVRIYNRALSAEEIQSLYEMKNSTTSDTQTLGAGYYYYEAFAPETQNYTKSALLLPLNITQNTSTANYMNLTINGTESNKTYTYPSAVNATGYFNSNAFIGTAPTFTLYRYSNTSIGTSNPQSDIQTLPNGTHWYVYNTSGNANYSSASKSFYITITKATPTLSIQLTNNNTDYGLTDTAQCSITAGDSSATLTLYRNTSQVATGTTPIQESVVLPAGYWNYTCVYSESQNYTSTSTTSWMLINKAKPVLVMNNGTASMNTSGMVGYWRFENESLGYAIDYSGYGNNGTLTSMNNSGNETSGPTTDGRFGNAMKFDGVNDYVDVGNTVAAGKDITVIAWAKSATSTWNTYGWVTSARVANGYVVHTNNGSTSVTMYVLNSSGNYFSVGSCSPSDITTWHQYGVIYDDNQNKAYVVCDGQLTQSDLDIVRTSGTIDPEIGRDYGYTNRYGNGTIDEVQIYNRSLSADEIKELYESTKPYGQPTTFTLTEQNTGDADVGYNLFWNTTNVTTTHNGTAIQLPAGYHYYLANTSGGQNYTRSALLLPVNITQNTSTTINYMNLTINGTESNKTYTYPSAVNATGWYSSIFNGQAITFTLYRYSNTSIGSSNPQSDIITLPNGTHWYVYNTSGNANYTSASKSFYIFINKASRTTDVTFDKASPQTYGTSLTVGCTVSAGNSDGTLKLYRNISGVDTDVTSTEKDQAIVLPIGDWKYICNITEGVNYTSATTTEYFTISKATPYTNLLINGTSSPPTIERGEKINITSYASNTALATKQYANFSGGLTLANITPLVTGTNVNITDTTGLNWTTYQQSAIYQISANTTGNENYTDNSTLQTIYITVQDTIAPNIWNLKIRDTSDAIITSTITGVAIRITVNVTDTMIYYVRGNFTYPNGTNVTQDLVQASPTSPYTHIWTYNLPEDVPPGEAKINVTAYDTAGNANSTNTTLTIEETAYLDLYNQPINFTQVIPAQTVNASVNYGWPLLASTGGNIPMNLTQKGEDLMGLIDANEKIIVSNITWNQTTGGTFSSLASAWQTVANNTQPGTNQSIYYKLYVPTIKPQNYGGNVTIKGSKP